MRRKGGRETEGKGMKDSEVKATEVQDSQETGEKCDMLMGEREMDNMPPGDTAAGLHATEGNRRKSYSEVVIDGMRRRASGTQQSGRLTER